MSVLISFFIPNVSLMSGIWPTEGGVGLILCLWLGSILISLPLDFLFFGAGLVINFLFTLPLWVLGMVHAYGGSRRWNAAHGIIF